MKGLVCRPQVARPRAASLLKAQRPSGLQAPQVSGPAPRCAEMRRCARGPHAGVLSRSLQARVRRASFAVRAESGGAVDTEDLDAVAAAVEARFR